MPTFIVTKSNHLVEAGYKLSLNEQRLILSAISQLDGRKPIPKDNQFTITAEDFAATFNLPLKQAYETLDEAASRLYERDIKAFDKNGKTRERFRWVDGVKYWDGEAKVTLSFSTRIIPYLTMLHSQLTSYELKQISQLKTPYSIRFYEILIQFRSTGERYITLEKLYERLEITGQYSRFFNLRKRIIEPSIDDINKSTNLIVQWEIIKKGKTITGLAFFFEEKSGQKKLKTDGKNNLNNDDDVLKNKQQLKVSTLILEKAKEIMLRSQSRLDLYAIEDQFYEFIIKKGAPRNMETAFLGFVRTKIKQQYC